jgi:hypothetical protein
MCNGSVLWGTCCDSGWQMDHIGYPMAGCGIGVELSDFTTRELLSLVNFILEQIHSENNYIISTTLFILL